MVAVTAQEEGSLDPMRASQFTGAWTDDPSDDVGLEWLPGPDYYESIDNESVHLFEASDPRISGTWTQDMDIRAFPIDEAAGLFAVVWSGAVRIENEDGAWSGMFDGYGGGETGREWYRLEGEGAYEGLTTVLRWVAEGDIYEAVHRPGLAPTIAIEHAAPGAVLVLDADDPAPDDGVLAGGLIDGEAAEVHVLCPGAADARVARLEEVDRLVVDRLEVVRPGQPLEADVVRRALRPGPGELARPHRVEGLLLLGRDGHHAPEQDQDDRRRRDAAPYA